MMAHGSPQFSAMAAPSAAPPSPLPASLAALDRLDRTLAQIIALRQALDQLGINLAGPQPEQAGNVTKLDQRPEPLGIIPRAHALLDRIDGALAACANRLMVISSI